MVLQISSVEIHWSDGAMDRALDCIHLAVRGGISFCLYSRSARNAAILFTMYMGFIKPARAINVEKRGKLPGVKSRGCASP